MLRRGALDNVLKSSPDLTDEQSMLLLLQTLLTVAYVVVVGRVWLVTRQGGRRPLAPCLPAADSPPEGALAPPPSGEDFESYVDDGMAALDAYLSEGFAT
jgi:hypothetical protein